MELKKLSLGIELGSTRIKGVLIDENNSIICQGFFEWENECINGIWTYSYKKIIYGLQSCYKDLSDNFFDKYNQKITTLGSIGISGMMHGYLPLDKNDNVLVPFRTWRNTITEKASAELTKLFNFNIPQRWSIAHLYQAILNNEEHIKKVSFITTISGYIHYLLTGKKVLGIGDASGVFPIDEKIKDYDSKMIEKFDILIKDYHLKTKEILPKVLLAGNDAGVLTEKGSLLLDPSNTLKAGIRMCPPEGDAGTGMISTNSIRKNTGNVSAGTSDFAMIVTDKKLNVHREIDMVSTPNGVPVAMVHCNNCTSDINAWVNIFNQVIELTGNKIDKNELFNILFKESLKGDYDCGSLLAFNYFSGEGITNLNEGRPFIARMPNSNFNLANFMKVNIMTSLATLKIGLDILIKEENVKINKIYGHGGFFKTPEIGQLMLSSAINAKVSVMKSAGEGGPYGMALLASYLLNKKANETLEDYLDNKVFKNVESTTIMASKEEVDGFNLFIERYKKGLIVEKTLIENLN